MRERGSGRIVSVTSIGGLIGQTFNDAYCAAKFAVEGMMESLAPVARELGLHVSVIEPGPVHTEFVDSVRALSAELLAGGAPGYEKFIGAYAAATGDTFSNHGQSGEEIGEVIHAALTDENPPLRYITSDYAKGVAGMKYTDLTGDNVVDLFQGRLRGDA
jgi:NAD(P)-dependent dehydrogenase (short-subunit alcohol dehydrogenase family)